FTLVISNNKIANKPDPRLLRFNQTPWCPFFVKVEEDYPNIPSNPFTISSHAPGGSEGARDCDCFSIREDYLRPDRKGHGKVCLDKCEEF
ncbi:hypothetical protein KUCAC02_007037, partial [Chaenocephalus aceratus]